jgi:hypothetical protein
MPLILAAGLMWSGQTAHAEYLRLTTTPPSTSRMVMTFEELVARLDRAGLISNPPAPPTQDPYLGYGCGGEYAYLSVARGQEYVDISWYRYDTHECAERHVEDVSASSASYGGPAPLWVFEAGRIVQVSSYGSQGLAEDVVRLARGER